MIGALLFMARQNQKSGWRRERNYLSQDIQDTMEQLMNRMPQAAAPPVAMPTAMFTPEASLSFSLQLAKLHSTLAAKPSVAPAAPATPVTADRSRAVLAARA